MTPKNPEHLAFLFQVPPQTTSPCLACVRPLHAGHHGRPHQPAHCHDVGHLPTDPGEQNIKKSPRVKWNNFLLQQQSDVEWKFGLAKLIR